CEAARVWSGLTGWATGPKKGCVNRPVCWSITSTIVKLWREIMKCTLMIMKSFIRPLSSRWLKNVQSPRTGFWMSEDQQNKIKSKVKQKPRLENQTGFLSGALSGARKHFSVGAIRGCRDHRSRRRGRRAIGSNEEFERQAPAGHEELFERM